MNRWLIIQYKSLPHRLNTAHIPKLHVFGEAFFHPWKTGFLKKSLRSLFPCIYAMNGEWSCQASKKTQKHHKSLIKSGWYDSWSLLKSYNSLQFCFCVNDDSFPLCYCQCLSSLNHAWLEMMKMMMMSLITDMYVSSRHLQPGPRAWWWEIGPPHRVSRREC